MRRFGGKFLAGFILGICSIAFLASWVFAEIQKTGEDKTPHKEEPVQLGKVVVTATRYRMPVKDIPASVTVISREQIEESSGLRLDYILRKYAGIDVKRSSFLTHSANVVLRGMGEMPGRTLILFDGIPMNKADTGTANWDLLLPEDVERIEIVRGPTSALYGSNAMGGVINIITRKPTPKPVTFEARGLYGTFDTWDAGGTISGKADKLGYYLSYDYLDSDGYNPVPRELRTKYDVKRYLEESHLKSKVTYEFPNESKVTLGYLFFDDKRGEGEKIRYEDGVYRKWKTNAPSLAYEWSIGASKWLFKAFYNKEDYFWNRERLRKGKYTWYKVDVDRIDAGGSLQSSFPILSWNLITTGFDFKYGSVDGDDNYLIEKDNPSDKVVHNEGKQHTYSLFINDHLLVGQRMVVDAGLRFDYVRSYDGKFEDSSGFLGSREYKDKSWERLSPRVAALYRIGDNTSIRGSIGSAFRAPILDDLYRRGIFRGRIYAANPELEPEKLISYELGITHRFKRKLSLSVAGYLSRGKDFFYPIKVGIDPETGRDLYQRKNVGKVRIRGLEIEGSWDISRTVSLFGNYTFNVSKIDEFSEQPELEGKYLEYSPRHKANLGLGFHDPGLFQAEIMARYVGERYSDTENTSEGKLDDYTVFDIKLSRRFFETCKAYIDILNLFDKDIKYSSDFEGPGREIRVGLSLKF